MKLKPEPKSWQGIREGVHQVILGEILSKAMNFVVT